MREEELTTLNCSVSDLFPAREKFFCILLSACMWQQFYQCHVKIGERVVFMLFFVLCGVDHYNEMDTEALSFVRLQPSGYAFSNSEDSF